MTPRSWDSRSANDASQPKVQSDRFELSLITPPRPIDWKRVLPIVTNKAAELLEATETKGQVEGTLAQA